MPAIHRKKADRIHDQKMLHELIKLAAGVELFTIPLYMTSLYSIAGVQAQTNGTVVPYIGPNLSYSLQGKASQKAYNIIYSVYIQEMLHLQLALNIGNALGATAALTQPKYPYQKNDPNWIPCLGKLANLNPTKYPEFAKIKAELGPLDENTINLFLAIELPDEDSKVAAPSVPLSCAPSDVETTTFGGIGKLYKIIQQYMDFEYTDDNNLTLFEYCYNEATNNGKKKLVQVNQFTTKKNGSTTVIPEYSHMALQITEGATAKQAHKDARDMIRAIVSEGEGSSKSGHDFVSPNYRPTDSSVPVDQLWDTYSHWARFEEVKCIYKDVLTWPKWRAARIAANPNEGPWLWTDLLADPLAPGMNASAIDGKAAAKQKATAWNSPSIAPQLNDVLNSTFNSFLISLNNSWSNTPINFPFPAMTSISSRVTSVWAAGGVPEFKKPTGGSTSKTLHACQGLNATQEVTSQGTFAAGQCDCATAIAHTCAGTNTCKGQGGCGYSVTTPQDAPTNFIPGQNSGSGDGGCGAPIPSMQVFHRTDNKGATGQRNGDNVWGYARTLFFQKNPSVQKTTLTPSALRIVLPPS